MLYKEAFMQALANVELVAQYDRLTKSKLSACIQEMEEGGDEYEKILHNGKFTEEIKKFDKFFFDFIWSRMPQKYK